MTISSEKTPPEDELQKILLAFKYGNWSQVLGHTQKLLEQFPDNRKLLSFHGNAAASLGSYETAINAFGKILKIDKHDPDANNNMGIVLLESKKYREAVPYFSRAAEREAKNSTFHSNFAAALILNDRLKEAGKALKKAIQLDPKNVDAHQIMGQLSLNQGDFKAAHRSFEIALTNNPCHYKAKIGIIKALTAYSPEDPGNSPFAEANNQIRKAIKFDKLNDKICDKAVLNMCVEAAKIVNDNEISINYPETQIYRRNQFRLNCGRHEKIFNEYKIIPEFCFGCFKIQIEPRNIIELLKLYVVFDRMELRVNNTRKCMVELREKIGGFYKGLIYCSSLDEAEAIHEYVTQMVHERIHRDISCKIKRGCSEFSELFPKYGIADRSDAQGLMEYDAEWAAKEREFDAHYPSDRPLTTAQTLSGFSLQDFLIIQHWIGYAKGIGDRSIDYDIFNQIGSKRLLKLAKKRLSLFPFNSQKQIVGPIGYVNQKLIFS